MLESAEQRYHAGPSRRPDSLLLRMGAALDRGTLLAIIAVFVLSRLAWMAVFRLGPTEFVTALCQWDCKWYLGIVQRGYDVAPHFDTFQADWAFFPAYPVLVRLTASLTTLPALVAGTLVSNLAIIVGAWVACRYLDRVRPKQGKTAFIVLSLAGPYSFYFATVYSEAIFFLLVVAVFWLWSSDRPILAGIGAALLSATRAIGLFIAVALLIDLVVRHGRNTPRKLLERPDIVLALLLAPLGLAAFMIYLYLRVGDTMAFSHVQVAWGREFIFPLFWLAAGLLHYDLPKLASPVTYSYFYSSLWAVLAIGLLGWLAWQRRWPEFTFGLFCLIVPLSAGLTSIPRFVAGCPIFLFAANDLISRLRSRTVQAALLGVAVAANFVLLQAWFSAAVSVI